MKRLLPLEELRETYGPNIVYPLEPVDDLRIQRHAAGTVDPSGLGEVADPLPDGLIDASDLGDEVALPTLDLFAPLRRRHGPGIRLGDLEANHDFDALPFPGALQAFAEFQT